MSGARTTRDRPRPGPARHDPRVSAAGLGPAGGRAMPCKAVAFAESIRGRYEHGPIERPPLAIALPRPRPPLVLRPIHRRTELRIAPRFAPTLVNQTLIAMAGPAPASRPSGDRASGRRPTPAIDTPAVAPRLVTRSIDTIVRRLTAREIRIESTRVAGETVVAGAATPARAVPAPPSAAIPARAAPAPPGAAADPGGPAPRVVRRPAPPPPQADGQIRADSWTPASPGEPAWPRDDRPSRPAADPAALDVDRLTEHVMRALDRRVVAHRERMGWS